VAPPGQRVDAADFERASGRIRGFMIEYEKFLPPSSLPFVEELIDHDEHGLALRMMLEG